MSFSGKRFRRSALAVATVAALGTALFSGLAPTPGGASSHREAPLVAADPQVDSTDLYAFVSPDKPGTVTIISNWIPFEEPAGGPNFFTFQDGVHYDINIDNDGDALPDIIYRWIFTTHYRNPNTFLYNTGVVTALDDPDLNIYQTYDLLEIRAGGKTTTLLDDALVAPSDVGDASMPNYPALYDAAVKSACPNCRFWAGQADDPFALDLRVFDLLYGANFSEVGDDTLAGFNINGFAMQVPQSRLAAHSDPKQNPVIGIWTTAERHSVRVQNPDGSIDASGDFVQVSRLGMPLVNEVVVPVSLKDYFNASQPQNDAQFLPAVLDPELPHDVNAIYGLPVPDCNDQPPVNRDCDLVPVFLTGIPGLNDFGLNKGIDQSKVVPSEMLRLNMSIPPCTRPGCTPNRLGVIAGDNAGFPNGRRLNDDVIDIALRVVEGILIPGHPDAVESLGDGVDRNDVLFVKTFPYLAYPHSGSNPTPHDVHRV